MVEYRVQGRRISSCFVFRLPFAFVCLAHNLLLADAENVRSARKCNRKTSGGGRRGRRVSQNRNLSCNMPVSASYSRRLRLIALTTLASGLLVAATFMPKIRADNVGTATVSEHFVRRLSTSSGTLIDEDEELPDLFPFSWPQDYLGFGSAILGLLLAAGGGIGGGGILVPIYILVLEFPVKHAIPLASTTVLGGAIASNMWNARKRHPDHPERPLIDWDLILQLEPLTIAGALFGADLNKELPELVLLVLMLLLLTVTAQKTLSKAVKLYRKEEEDMIKSQRQRQAEDAANENTALIPSRETHFDIENKESGLSTGADEEERNGSADDVEVMIAKQCLIDALKLCLLFAVVTVLDLLQGTPDGNGEAP